MEEKNELNDIILNKSTHNGNNKKLLLAVATLALILIIVVVIMNSLKSEGTDNLPQAVLPPEPIAQNDEVRDDPLFEPVEVIEEAAPDDDRLNKIAQKLKEESLKEEAPQVIEEEEVVVVEPEALTPPKPVVVKSTPAVVKPKPKPAVRTPKVAQKGQRYIQVGSFSKFAPSATFIKKIERQGYGYTYHKVQANGKTVNKVLVGPFNSEGEARKALKQIRKSIESGAFLTKV
ncbi:MAG: SPOR domain-containing protein [Campylobacterota bacterium]|nr:SPOR domain-containing protein [Campylobacterota bacterium]